MNPDLSIVVPAHNEEECIESTLEDLCKTLEKESIDYEVIVSNDHSTDSTGRILDDLCKKNPRIKHIENTKPNGFGFAVRSGFEQANGEWVAVMMADASDDPRDLVNFYLEGTQKETDAVLLASIGFFYLEKNVGLMDITGIGFIIAGVLMLIVFSQMSSL